MTKIIAIDFSGTLIKPFVAEAANLKRYSILGIPKPSEEEHNKMHGDKSHYKIVKEYVSKEYGITDDMKLGYVQNYGNDIELTGKDMKTIIMTDLFRNAMFAVAKEEGLKIFSDNAIETLEDLKNKGYKLAILSGIRKDIITGMLAISNCPINFDYIYGQDPVLSRDDNKLLLDLLSKDGVVDYVIGDKSDDLRYAKELEAKSILLKGGHAKGDEQDFADYTINNFEELRDIIN